MPSLFDPLQLGDITIPNRIIMAPLTRSRAGAERIPNKLMAEYYAQRAAAGLIISEATSVAPMGVGYADTPGLWSTEQVEGWKIVTKAVHNAGGRIFAQLWHVGRVSAPMFLNGELPVAPSAIRPAGHVSIVRPKQDYVTPRALDIKEIPGIIEAYRKAAMNAQMAGFDGVELHGANGYLLDQFLQDGTNHRDDEYGGAIENRARLLLEATDAAASVWGPDLVGVHLAPRGDSHDISDSNKLATFSYVARELDERGIAFLCVRERSGNDAVSPALRRLFSGVFIANEGYTAESAQAALDEGAADAVAFGKPFIANPDLVARIRNKAAWNEVDPGTFYAPGPQGYTDYPVLETI
ncbi:MAG TPA: alkene reductase [Acidocella sp.]|jgi:2,4-dienoyl-CoA reductase-like NADH-dependent reductase (Old Yellow Enzyme family)|nr:alkene reductase [Acidocella sp.]